MRVSIQVHTNKEEFPLVEDRQRREKALSPILGDAALERQTALSSVPIYAPQAYNWAEDEGYLAATAEQPQPNQIEPLVQIPLEPGQDPALALTAGYDPNSRQIRPNS